MDIKSHAFTLPFLKKEQIAKDTFAFYFDRTKEQWDFYPGQYVRMMLPHDHPDDRGTMRYFTISSSPTDTTHLRIITKVIASSFKKNMYSLRAGDAVSFYGPNGDFYFQEDKPSHVLLAGGIGMTPFISLIQYVAAKSLKQEITLIVSFSTTEEMILYEQLSQISEKHKNIKVVYTITNPQNMLWKGATGRISAELIKKYVPDIVSPLYYIVGPPPMVEATVQMVGEMVVPEEHILQEHFSGY